MCRFHSIRASVPYFSNSISYLERQAIDGAWSAGRASTPVLGWSVLAGSHMSSQIFFQWRCRRHATRYSRCGATRSAFGSRRRVFRVQACRRLCTKVVTGRRVNLSNCSLSMRLSTRTYSSSIIVAETSHVGTSTCCSLASAPFTKRRPPQAIPARHSMFQEFHVMKSNNFPRRAKAIIMALGLISTMGAPSAFAAGVGSPCCCWSNRSPAGYRALWCYGWRG